MGDLLLVLLLGLLEVMFCYVNITCRILIKVACLLLLVSCAGVRYIFFGFLLFFSIVIRKARSATAALAKT